MTQERVWHLLNTKVDSTPSEDVRDRVSGHLKSVSSRCLNSGRYSETALFGDDKVCEPIRNQPRLRLETVQTVEDGHTYIPSTELP